MILIDAVYIYDGGGKVLFDLLVDELQKKPVDVYYLVDKRIAGMVKATKRKHPMQRISILPLRK
jgi:hypothetical protein